MQENKIKRLFVYGTLTNPNTVRTIAGQSFPMRKAILEGYEKISSTTFFPYILRRSGGLVRGQVLEELDEETLKEFDRFEGEGEMYRRQKVKVLVGGKTLQAYTYVGNKHKLLRYFDRGVDVDDRIQDHLEDEMEAMLSSQREKPARRTSKRVYARAKAEFYGSTISDLVAAHFDYTGIPKYVVRKGLNDSSLPSLKSIAVDQEALQYADNYISLVVRHIVFNQLEHQIRREFRGSVKASTAMYAYTISCLLALRQLNAHKRRLRGLMKQEGVDHFDTSLDYLDYATAGVRIPNSLYDRREISERLIRILSHLHAGRTPLGAEIEMSELGARAVSASQGEDSRFDSFYYFHDFDLARRCWKLGGYLDDHSMIHSPNERTRGFFEYAFGRLNLEGNIAKPATQDPWILSKLINEALRFAEVPPHSLHITIQPPENTEYQVLEDVDYLKCLLMLGGDFSEDDNGVLREKRIWQEEVVSENVGLCFSKFNFHPAGRVGTGSRPVRLVEYQFPRLRADEPHEILIMAIKGFQLGYRPLPFISSEAGRLYELYSGLSQALVEWAEKPTPISSHTISEFLQLVEDGLMTEDKGHPSHSQRLVEDSLSVIEDKINELNLRLAQSVLSDIYVVGTVI